MYNVFGCYVRKAVKAIFKDALLPVIPSVEEFPYCIRVVSEVLSSNGSTSQGSICGSTLSLMAAGVPIKAPVAGISCGLITEGDRFMTMVDIQGLEDFFGDMDFKVAGTKKGITAIQMDLKVHGLTPEIIKEALEKTYKARCYILDEIMLPVIPEPRKELSKYAPKMLSTKVPVDKIAEVIGKQGKVIQKICAEFDCFVVVEEDGSVFVCSQDIENAKRAIFMIETIANDPEVGAIYKGVVTRIMDFGAFVEIAPGKEGLVHISHLDVKRVDKVTDVVNVGDEVIVKVIHGGVGNINESDVVLASASNAIIIGFNVKPDNQARIVAEREKVDLRLYSVIYNAIEDVEAALKGMLEPIYEEKIIGHAEIRQIFKASGVGNIAGAIVTEGRMTKDSIVRITRDKEQIYEGPIATLKHFKDDVKEVKAGSECGMVFENFGQIQEGDLVEAHIMVEVPR